MSIWICVLIQRYHTIIVLQLHVLVSGLSRAVCFVIPFPAASELFGDYGSDVATVLAMLPFGFGFLIGAPLSG